MGSSGGGGTPRAPNMPAPPGNMIAPQGSTAPFAPNYTSFLPTDPNAMATGLTPQMLNSINSPAPAAPAQASATGGQMSPDAMRNMIAQMMGPRQMTGEDLFMSKLTGQRPSWQTPQMANQAREDSIMRQFAGSMGGGSARGSR